jgi:ChaB protein
MPARDVMPSTIKRSPSKAQRTWAKTHDNAVREYGEGERAHRTAFAALKHAFEKQGDRWVPKSRKGPSDPRARLGGRAARAGRGDTFGGVDYYGHTKDELYARARRLGVRGRASMTKKELAKAIANKQS